MKFFTFNQNNSGGYFITDKENGVCETVIIEAHTAKEAKAKLVSIGENVSGFDEYCNCCGERWSYYMSDEDGKESPMVYGVPIDEVKKDFCQNMAFVHYLDGTKKEYNFK